MNATTRTSADKARFAFAAITIGMAALVVAAGFTAHATGRFWMAGAFFAAPLVAFYVPGLVAYKDVAGARAARGWLTVAAVAALATIALGSILELGWWAWIVGAVVALCAGLAAAAKVGAAA